MLSVTVSLTKLASFRLMISVVTSLVR
jgi:hypothetical protein